MIRNALGSGDARHDFRRLFATNPVNHGLPMRIGAALLRHLDVQTTHGYVTVFQGDVIRHYQIRLAGRRAARVDREYRTPTPTEWAEPSDSSKTSAPTRNGSPALAQPTSASPPSALEEVSLVFGPGRVRRCFASARQR